MVSEFPNNNYIMFAFRKFESLNYHLENTKELLKKEAELLDKENIALPEVEETKAISVKMKQSKDSMEINKKMCEKFFIDLIEILNNLNFEYDRIS